MRASLLADDVYEIVDQRMLKLLFVVRVLLEDMVGCLYGFMLVRV